MLPDTSEIFIVNLFPSISRFDIGSLVKPNRSSE